MAHVVYWDARAAPPPDALHAAHFGHAFFATLRNCSATVPEARAPSVARCASYGFSGFRRSASGAPRARLLRDAAQLQRHRARGARPLCRSLCYLGVSGLRCSASGALTAAPPCPRHARLIA